MKTIISNCIASETLWAPSMALNGVTHMDVMQAVDHMRQQQTFVMRVICVAGFSIVIAASLFIFAKEGVGVGFMVMCVFISGLYFIVSEGSKALSAFHEGRSNLRFRFLPTQMCCR